VNATAALEKGCVDIAWGFNPRKRKPTKNKP